MTKEKNTRKSASVTRRTIRITILVSISFALIALIIGMVTYATGLINQHVDRAFRIAQQARTAITRSADAVGLSRQVMRVYRSLTPEQRKADDYLQHYVGIDQSLADGEAYDLLYHMLQTYIVGVDDVYLAMIDPDNNILIYIVDPDVDPEKRLALGEWEQLSETEAQKIMNWDGKGKLYDISDTDQYGWMCTAAYPVKNDDGEVAAFVMVDVLMDGLLTELNRFALQMGVALLLATALVAFIVARHIRKSVAQPINAIAQAAREYAEDKVDGLERAHFSDLGIKSSDEIENLAAVMADMENDLAEHEKHLTQITAEKERISTELSMAARIQSAALPSVFPPFPDRKEFDLYAVMDPARVVGGDFYDFFLIDDDHLGLIIADVSDKGIPAALFMMASKVVLKSFAMLGKAPSEILARANEVLCDNNQARMFVTVWLGILEISTGKVVAANAGHELPAVLKDGRFTLLNDRHGMVVGGLEGVKYHDYEILLEPGDKIFVYTDGLKEAADPELQLFGIDRILETLNQDTGASPGKILENVRTAVSTFVKDAEQFDDLTMLCVEYKGTKES